MNPSSARIGIDLGGTKIEGIVLSADGTERARQRVATPTRYDLLLDALTALVASLERAHGAPIDRIGMGIPGVISARSGCVKNANMVWLNGRPLDADLSARLGRAVRVANDANCFALSEAADGAGAGAAVVFGVILGTGVGGGVVVRGRALDGVNRIAGEWGHNPLPRMTDLERPGPSCYCGRRGCVETFLSGPSMARDHQRFTGLSRTPAEIAAEADAHDPHALATLARYTDRLARALAGIVNVLDPEVIVLGGGMSNVRALYAPLRESLAREVFSDDVATRVLPNMHGDSSGVRGAAWLWPVDDGH